MSAPVVLALPPGRAYEMVSPEYKGGYSTLEISGVAPDGDALAFTSLGAFNGAPTSQTFNAYVAHRQSDGWSTQPLMPPAALAPFDEPVDFSPTLTEALSRTRSGQNLGNARYEGVANQFLLHSTDAPAEAADFAPFGRLLEAVPAKAFDVAYVGASRDYSNAVVESFVATPLLNEALGTELNLYDMPADGGSLGLIAIRNNGAAIDTACRETLGTGVGGRSEAGAISDDGSEIFFTVSTDGAASGCAASHQQVFVRLGGSKTLEVSRQLQEEVSGECVEGLCEDASTRAGSVYQGASSDGSKVFFTTTARLVPGDTDGSNNLYLAEIGCPGGASACATSAKTVSGLTVASPGLSGEATDVQGVVTIAPDGSRVYFVARGVLTDVTNARGQLPIKGADNLYVYDSAHGGQPTFIGDLCSGPELSGEVDDNACGGNLDPQDTNDTPLWLSGTPEAQIAGQGRYMLFTSYARLATADADDSRDVYLYDAESGELGRISVGEGGYDGNGNGSGQDAAIAKVSRISARVAVQARLATRAISEDGTRVVFTTGERLSPRAAPGVVNAYEWHGTPGASVGTVSLVSSGASSEPVDQVVITPDGDDIFFSTTEGLLPQDTDGAGDVYDARLEGGFAAPPASPQPCSGDACQGPLSIPAPLLVPGSVLQSAGGNFSGQVGKPAAKKKKARKAKSKSGSKRKKAKLSRAGRMRSSGAPRGGQAR